MKIESTSSVIGSFNAAKPQTLKEATQEFESLFIHQLFQSMQKTVPNSMFGSQTEGIFRDLLHQEYAQQISRSGGIGLAEMLYKQLSDTLGEPGP